MELVFKDIILRDYKEEDIEDDIRWMTKETAWHDWDAPWEAEEALKTFNAEEFRQKKIKQLANPLTNDVIRRTFEIDIKDNVHIGKVNSYFIDDNFSWQPKGGDSCFYTIGIDICESSYWSSGYGTQAFTAFIKYYIDNGIYDIYMQTWSGNERMLALGKKLGFTLCQRNKDFRHIKGKDYDGLTFKLVLEEFMDFFADNFA